MSNETKHIPVWSFLIGLVTHRIDIFAIIIGEGTWGGGGKQEAAPPPNNFEMHCGPPSCPPN